MLAWTPNRSSYKLLFRDVFSPHKCIAALYALKPFILMHTHTLGRHSCQTGWRINMTSGKVGPVSDQRRNISTISHLCMALTLISLTVKSIATEHEFSILSNSFASQQESSLEDYVQLSVMLQYNYQKSQCFLIFSCVHNIMLKKWVSWLAY